MINIEYGAISVGAKEEFAPELLNFASFSNAEDLQKNLLDFKRFANPCEGYSALLDGNSVPIPSSLSGENIGGWSEYASNANGEFTDGYPTAIFTSPAPYNLEGFTIGFDEADNIYATDLHIAWHSGENIIVERDYTPNSARFVALQSVESCDKIQVVFRKINTPYTRLKLREIEYGSILQISEKSIKNIRVHQKVDTISTTLPIGTVDLRFINSNDAEFHFSSRQTLLLKNNNILIGKFFIDTAKQTNKLQWVVKAQDYIAILESVDFEGGIYKGEYAETILNAIFAKSGVPFVLSDEFKQEKLSGYIPYTNCRKALQQVLIAIGGYARTAYSEAVDIVKLSENAVSNIPLQKIYEGQNVEVNSDVTEVEIFAHKYTVTDNATIIFTASEAEENLKVIFNEPMHSLWVENGRILECGTNYAIINCDENGVLNGRKYEHSMVSKTKRNTSATSKSANKKTIRDATLVSAQNVDKVLNLCYNSIVKNTEIRAKVVEDNEPYIVGNAYSIDTEMIGNVKGVLLEQNFNLYGGAKVAKEMVIK